MNNFSIRYLWENKCGYKLTRPNINDIIKRSKVPKYGTKKLRVKDMHEMINVNEILSQFQNQTSLADDWGTEVGKWDKL